MPSAGAHLGACPCCGLVQELPPLPPGGRALCARCRVPFRDPERRAASRERTRAAAIAALVLYPVAISLPVLRMERLGHHTEASVWTGAVSLLRAGETTVGIVVLVCSIVLPLVKLVGLVAITSPHGALALGTRASTYRWIEWSGRFGMLDVLLVALMVAWIKFGDVFQVRPGPGALAFTACVLTSLLASAWFDPHALWDDEGERA